MKRFGFSHLPLFDGGEYGVAVEMKSPHAPLELSVLRELGVLELTYRRNFYLSPFTILSTLLQNASKTQTVTVGS